MISGGVVFLAIIGFLWLWNQRDQREQRYWQKRVEDERKKRRSK